MGVQIRFCVLASCISVNESNESRLDLGRMTFRLRLGPLETVAKHEESFSRIGGNLEQLTGTEDSVLLQV